MQRPAHRKIYAVNNEKYKGKYLSYDFELHCFVFRHEMSLHVCSYFIFHTLVFHLRFWWKISSSSWSSKRMNMNGGTCTGSTYADDNDDYIKLQQGTALPE